MITFITALGVFTLFSTGAGGRHDWMRFHSDNVPCPKDSCYGNLKWVLMLPFWDKIVVWIKLKRG